MATDYLIPKNNEEELIKTAQLLGYNKLVFLYDDENIIFEKKKNAPKTNIIIKYGILTSKPLRNKNYPVFLMRPKNLRHAIESRGADTILSFEIDVKKDFMHHRASGINHILCSLMKERKVKVALSFLDIIKTEKKEQLLGRIRQNIMLCKKYKVDILFGSFARIPIQMRHVLDLRAFFNTLSSKNNLNYQKTTKNINT